MASPRSPERDRAFEIWIESDCTVKMKDIAAQLGVPDSRIRKWKTLDKWEEKKVERSTKEDGALHKNKKGAKEKKQMPKRRRGGQPGNKNAIGNRGGAPLGNKNALTTGEYETISWDCLTEEEKELYLQAISMDKVEQVKHDLALAAVKERRMLQRVRELLDGKKTVKETRTVKKEGSRPQVVECTDPAGNKSAQVIAVPGMQVVEESEVEYSVYDTILRIEDALTRLQNAKTRSLALKHVIESEEIELEKLALSKARLLLDIEKSKGETQINLHAETLKRKLAARRREKSNGRA